MVELHGNVMGVSWEFIGFHGNVWDFHGGFMGIMGPIIPNHGLLTSNNRDSRKNGDGGGPIANHNMILHLPENGGSWWVDGCLEEPLRR